MRDVAEVLVGYAIRADVWLGLLVGAAVLALWLGATRLARWVGVVLCALVFALGLLPVGNMALDGLQDDYPVAPDLTGVDGIVVLGGSEDLRATARSGQPSVNDDSFASGRSQ